MNPTKSNNYLLIFIDNGFVTYYMEKHCGI